MIFKESLIIPEKLSYDEKSCRYIPNKRKLKRRFQKSGPYRGKSSGKVPAGPDKYLLIIHRKVRFQYKSGEERVETKAISWRTLSTHIKDRDKKCLKCGSTKHLEADHFHPLCYHWISWFMRPSKIQTLCKKCHALIPSMKNGRADNWKNYVYLK